MECKIIGADERHGYRYETWMTDDEFFVTVKRDDDEVFRTEHHANRGRVERSAEEWIAAEVAHQEKAPSVEAVGFTVAGWNLQATGPDPRGDFGVTVTDARTGEPAPEDFKGYMRAEQALSEAQAWCEANPVAVLEAPAVEPPAELARAEEQVEVFEVTQVEVEKAAEVAKECTEAATAASTAAAAATERAVSLLRAVTVDLEEHAEAAEQWHTLSLEIADLDEQIKALKADHKSKLLQRDVLAAKMSKGILAIISGRSAGPFQTRLPLAPTTIEAPMSQPAIAAAAEKVAHEIEGPEVPWAFNGCDHVILVGEVSPGNWRAALRGHEDRTEAFDADRSAAISACKDRASIVFADAEPGSTAIPDPPKRARGKGKKKGEEQPPPAEEAADAPRVIAALRLSMDLGEAAKKLKISVKKLQEWSAKNGISLSEHLGVELGKDEPSPAKKRGGKGARK